MDKLIKQGPNSNGVTYAIYKDGSIGDFYLEIEGGSRPVVTGTKAQCQAAANGWVK